jgi:hypothetical protein
MNKKIIIILILINIYLFELIEWTWVGGNEISPDSGLNFEINNNLPQPRQRAVGFQNLSRPEIFYLFGGRFSQRVRVRDLNNELWKFDLNQTTWTIIRNGTGDKPDNVFFKLYNKNFKKSEYDGSEHGVFKPKIHPGSREFHIKFSTSKNEQYIFGGLGYDCFGIFILIL